MASRIYATLLLYASSSSAAGYEPLFEETVTLIRATSTEHATQKALEFARSRQTSYENEQGETITWSLKHLIDVSEINDPLDDGAEIYTRHFRNYEAYRAFEPMLSGEIDN
jgi:Domain of unknown function (DUF4288)